MGEEGLGSVGTLMAATESVSGIGGIAAWIGDKITGSTSGSASVNSAYASLSGGAGAGILAMGMMSPDPGDAGRGVSSRLFHITEDLLYRTPSGVLQVNPRTDAIFKSALEESQARIVNAIGTSEVDLEEIAKQISLETDRVFGGAPGYSFDIWRSIRANATNNQRPAMLGEFISKKTGLCFERACYSATLSNLITPDIDSRVINTKLPGAKFWHSFMRYDDEFTIDTTFSISNPGLPFSRSSGVYDASEHMSLLSREGHTIDNELLFGIKFE